MLLALLIVLLVEPTVSAPEVNKNSGVSSAKTMGSNTYNRNTVMILQAKVEGTHTDFYVICSGTLLSHWWTLTGARCVFDFGSKRIPTSELRVFAGYNNAKDISGDPSVNENKREAEKLEIHPNYICCKYDEDNLALIKVSQKFDPSIVDITPIATYPMKVGVSHDCSVTAYNKKLGDTYTVQDSKGVVATRFKYSIKERTVTIRRRCTCSFKKWERARSRLVRVPLMCEHVNDHSHDTTIQFSFSDVGAGLMCGGKLFGVFAGVLNTTFYDSCGRRSNVDLYDVIAGESYSPHTLVFTNLCLHMRWLSQVTKLVTAHDVWANHCGELSERFSRYSQSKKTHLSLYSGAANVPPGFSTLLLTILLSPFLFLL